MNPQSSSEQSEPLSPLASEALVRRIAELAWDKKANNLRALRVLELVSYTDFLVVMSARSDRQVGAVVRHIKDTLSTELGLKPLSIEGTEQNQWAVLDYGDAVVHVFYEPVRSFYDLERLWVEAPELDLPVPADLTRVPDPYGG